jgi:hypothetical protein
VTLSSTTVQKPTFTAPSTPTTLGFQLTIDNGIPDGQSTAAVVITVSPFDPPVANAGGDASALVDTSVTLDATGSSDPDGHPLTYSWVQTAGPEVTLDGADTAAPSFDAPATPTSLTFEVTVDDGFGGTNTDDVTITVYNTAPVASAGGSQSVASSATVTLDASASDDADGHALTYSWSQVSGPAVTLSDTSAAKPTFTAPVGPATLSFQVTVDDGHTGTDMATVSVTVAGIPGLDYGTAVSGTVKGNMPKSVFKTTVTNLGAVTRTLNQTAVVPVVTVNGDAVPSSAVVVTAKTATVKPGKATAFVVTWNHGDTLQAGDIVEVAVCVPVAGDEQPGNNCSAVTQLTQPIDLSVSASMPVLRKTATANTFSVRVLNNGLETVAPLRNTNLVVTVQVGDGDPVTLTSTASKVALKPTKSKAYAFKWPHAKLAAGTSVTLNACVVVPGNQSASSCTAITGTVI